MQKYYYRNGKRITLEQLEQKIENDRRLYRAIENNTGRKPPEHKLINCAGACYHCKKQSIQYGITWGNYWYYCHTCGLYIRDWDVIAVKTA